MTTRHRWLIILLAALALGGCAGVGSAPLPRSTPLPTVTPVPTRPPAPTATLPPSPLSPSPTSTVRPAVMTAPTPTPRPPANPTVLPPSPTATVVPVAPTLPPTAISSPTLVRSDLSAQAAAVIPAAQNDLASLVNLPRYHIEMTVDPDGASYSGTERLLFTNNEGLTLDGIFLRLYPNARAIYGGGRLAVTGLTAAGHKIRSDYGQGGTVMRVPLPRPLPPGQQVKLTLAFEGQVPRDFGSNGEKTGYGIFNVSEGVLTLANFYPMLAVYDDEGWNLDPVHGEGDAVYSDAAFYDVSVTVARDVRVVTSGVAVDRQVRRDTLTLRYLSGPSRDFFMAMSRDFLVLTEDVDGTAVNSYYLPGQDEGGRAALRFATDALGVFDARFGPYPYTELDAVAVPLNLAAGVEYPGVILLDSDFYDTADEPFFEFATAHEVAHQWWYNVVGNDVIDEPWLDEALTNYSAAVYYEAVEGEEGLERTLGSWRRAYDNFVREGKDAAVAQPVPAFADTESYGVVVYIKGALFFHALREAVGDDAFFRALREYYQAHKYGIATPEDLLGAFEEASGRGLEELYRHWLYAAEGR